MEISLENISDDSLENFIESLYENTGIPIALFNNESEIIAVSDKAKLCKCSFMKFGKESTYCSLFAPFFIADIVKGHIIDRVCDNKSRISTRQIQRNDQIYHLALFQYLLETDVIEAENNNVDLVDKKLEEKYQWMPIVLTIHQREELLDKITEKLAALL